MCVIFTSLFVNFASKLTLKKAIAFSIARNVRESIQKKNDLFYRTIADDQIAEK